MIDVPGEYDGSVEEVRLDMLNTTSATLGVRESSVSYFR